MGISSLLVMVPTALSLMLIAWLGHETRGRDLRDLDADSGQLGHAAL
jgi:putative MFS transporter